MSLHSNTGSQQAHAHEVAVIGCGVVGLVASLVLASAGARVLLVGRKPPVFVPTEAQQFDPRVFALSHRSQRMLAQLRVWGNIPAEHLQAVHEMQVWGDSLVGDQQGALNFSASESGVDALTWIVEQRSLLQVLFSAVQFHPNIQTLPANADCLERTANGWRIQTTEQTVEVPLLIAADGANSKTRSIAGLDFDMKSYGFDGVVSTYAVEKSHQGIARQWFDDGAILALLPLPGKHVSMVWSMPFGQAEAFKQKTLEEQAKTVHMAAQGAVASLYGQLTPCGQTYAFPLRHGVAPVWFDQRVVLMGDAAHVVHPLSGQGLNLGLEDVAELAHCLQEMRFPGFGKDNFLLSERLWNTWARRRKAACMPMHFLTKGLHTLFRLDVPGAALIRNQGMRWVNQVPMLKRWLSQQAMR